VEEYLLRLAAAALICGVATTIIGKKSTLGAVVRLLAGIYLTLSIVSPWLSFRLNNLEDWSRQLNSEGERISNSGQEAAKEAIAESIIQRTETYILDKANSLGAVLTVEVILDNGTIPAPCQVRLSGNISPYAKQSLCIAMEQELGIPSEAQIWT